MGLRILNSVWSGLKRHTQNNWSDLKKNQILVFSSWNSVIREIYEWCYNMISRLWNVNKQKIIFCTIHNKYYVLHKKVPLKSKGAKEPKLILQGVSLQSVWFYYLHKFWFVQLLAAKKNSDQILISPFLKLLS